MAKVNCVNGHTNPPRNKHGCLLCKADKAKTPEAKAKTRAYMAKYRAANREQVTANRLRWEKANPETVLRKSRRNNWKKKGIDVAEAEALLSAHNNGHCEICGGRSPGGAGGWHVDHDHKTGKVRGVLCSNCNRALGYFQDDADVLRMAVSYLAARS